MKRTLIIGCVAAALLTGITLASPAHRTSQTGERTVPLYSGEVNVRTADRFLAAVSRNADRVIALKVRVDPSSDNDFRQSGYLADLGGDQLVISRSGRDDGGIEVVKNGPVGRDGGKYVIDGVFIVKSGGVHQGVRSFGLQPADETAVRLNPSVRIVERPF